MEEILKYTPNAETIHQQLIITQFKFENNRLKYINTKQVDGLGLRVIKDGRIGFSSTTASTSQDLTTLIENASNSAKFGQEAKFTFPKSQLPAQVKIFDKEVENFSIEEGIELGKTLIEQLLAIENEFFVKEIDINKGILNTKITNTTGLELAYQKTTFTIYISGLLVRNNSLLWLNEYISGCNLNKDIDSIVKKIKETVQWAKNEVLMKKKKLPAIFTPKVIPTILETVELGVNGKLVQKGASPLTGRLDEKIFDEKITIYDDATIDFGLNSYPVDGEGVATRRIPLIEKGILKNYIFDLQTAGMLNTNSTGSGHRDFDSLPAPHCSNLIVSVGDMDFYDMIKDMKEGIIIDLVLGGGQSNVLAGEFAFNLGLGFKVENGEVIGRLKDTMVACNIFDIFNKIRALGSKLYSFGAVKSPHFYIDEVNVAGKG